MRILSAAAVLLFALILTGTVATAEPLKVGVIIPISGPGAAMGESMVGDIRLSNLKNIAPVIEDDRCEGKNALTAYEKLKTQGIKVFYMACSGSILAVAPRAKEHGDVIFTTYSGSARVRETGDEVIRLNPDALSVADGIARLLGANAGKAIILHEEQEYAQSLADRLSQLLGPAIADRVTYRPDAPSFASEILKIKQRRPKQIIFVPVADGAAKRILQQLALSRVEAPIIGDVNLCDFPFRPSDFGLHGSCVAARFTGPDYEAFLKNFNALLGHPPANPFYDAMTIDLFTRLDTLAPGYTDVPKLKEQVLAGFSGRFSNYKLSAIGESENADNYLQIVSY